MSTDLTSALFLGPAPRVVLAGSLASGRPPLLDEPSGPRLAARALARANGAEDGLLSRTSFHGLLDAIEAAGSPSSTVLVDEHVYPVARWAAAAAARVPWRDRKDGIMSYRHLDAADALRCAHAAPGPVVVVTDGLCGSCLRPAPLAALAAVARTTTGWLVVDDTLAAGVLGRRTPGVGPLGAGGAGTAAFVGAPADDLVVVSSLAKGYGVPLAVMTGPGVVVDRARRLGSARTHASGPTGADVAALAALAPPDELERRRRRLARLVDRTRTGSRRLGLTPLGIPFAMVHLVGERRPTELRDALASRGVGVLVTVGRCTGRCALSVCLRSDLRAADVDRLLGALARAIPRSAA